MKFQPSPIPKQSPFAVAALALAGCLWGTGFLFGKISLNEMTVSEDVTYRFLSAVIVLSPIVLRRWRPYRGASLWILLIGSVIGIPIQFLVQFRGLQLTSVSHASLIVGVLPVMLAATSALFLHERLRPVEWGFLLLSAVGALLIAMSTGHAGRANSPQSSWHGDVLVLVSLVAAVVMILCTKKLIAGHDALHVTASSILIGTLALLVWVELRHPVRFHFSRTIWEAAVAQGLLATAGAYLFWNWGLTHMSASRAGVFLNLEPLVGTLLGVAVLHERLGRSAILGGFLIISAALYFSLHPHQA